MFEATRTAEDEAAVDERLGLVAMRLNYHLPAEGSQDANLIKAATFYPEVIKTTSLGLVRRTVRQSKDGGHEINFELEGHIDPKNASGEEFDLDATTSEDRIETNPLILELMETYGGVRKEDGSVYFSPYLPNTGGGEQVSNPMSGVTSYLVSGLIWTRTRVRLVLPDDMLSRLGKIDQPPSGPLNRPPNLDGRRNWLKIRAQATWRGNIWRITGSWLLSGPKGFTHEIY